MSPINAIFLQLLLTTVCLGQVSNDSPVTPVVSPVRTPQVFCYTFKIARTYREPAKFTTEDIDPKSCTHITYDYGRNLKDQLLFRHKEDAKEYEALVALRDRYPHLKILLSILGFKGLTTNAYKMHAFVKDTTVFLRKQKFNGLNLWDVSSRPRDAAALVTFLEKFRESFEEEAKISGQPKLLLTIVCSENLGPEGYNVTEMSKYADFINIWTIDFHRNSESTVGHPAPLHARKSGTSNNINRTVDAFAQSWVRLGAPKEKLIIGISTVARSFTLDDPNNFDIGAPSLGKGSAGEYFGEVGGMMHYEESAEEFFKKFGVLYLLFMKCQLHSILGIVSLVVNLYSIDVVFSAIFYLLYPGRIISPTNTVTTFISLFTFRYL